MLKVNASPEKNSSTKRKHSEFENTSNTYTCPKIIFNYVTSCEIILTFNFRTL